MSRFARLFALAALVAMPLTVGAVQAQACSYDYPYTCPDPGYASYGDYGSAPSYVTNNYDPGPAILADVALGLAVGYGLSGGYGYYGPGMAYNGGFGSGWRGRNWHDHGWHGHDRFGDHGHRGFGDHGHRGFAGGHGHGFHHTGFHGHGFGGHGFGGHGFGGHGFGGMGGHIHH
jgi:hypothetical protein